MDPAKRATELPVPQPIKRPQPRHISRLIGFCLAALTFAAYLPVFHAGLIDFDDVTYITNNTHLQSGTAWSKFSWAFTTRYANNWHPLTWLSLMLDATIFDGKAWGYHLTNLLLHILNTLLVYWLLRCLVDIGIAPQRAETSRNRTGELRPKSGIPETEAAGIKGKGALYSSLSSSPTLLWASAFVAALFAVHPLHVESVAWVTERKDVLSTFFFLLTLLAYIRLLLPRSPRPGGTGPSHRSLAGYGLVLTLYALGLMTKPMLVTLPVILLLIHYVRCANLAPASWNFSSSRRLALSLVPFFALAAASSILTIWAQENAISTLDLIPLGLRASNGLVACVAYMWKMLWPVGLSVFYRHPGTGLPQYHAWLSAGALAMISWAVLRQAQRRPYLAFGWLWYLITLLPVLGIVQVGAQSMADRYTYIPLVGLFIIIAFGFPDFVSSFPTSRLFGSLHDSSRSDPIRFLAPLSAFVILLLSVLTYRQAALWQDTVTLFSHAVHLDNRNYLAHNNLGVGLEKQGRLQEAGVHYLQSVKLRPNYEKARNNLAGFLAHQGKLDEAEVQYRRAVELEPKSSLAWNNLAGLFVKRGKLDDAIDAYAKALENQPDNPTINANVGRVLEQKGDLSGAIAYYTKALSQNPNDARMHLSLGSALQRGGKLREAIGHLSAAVRLQPDIFEAHVNLGIALGAAGKHDEAILHLGEAVRLAPGNTDAQINLGVALFKQGRMDDAIARFSKVLEMNPAEPSAHKNLAIALYYRGRYADAWDEVREGRKYGVTPDPQFIKILSQRMTEPR